MQHIDIIDGRIKGKADAKAKLAEVSHEAACSYWRDNACSDTLHAYGYWDGFLAVLAETR